MPCFPWRRLPQRFSSLITSRLSSTRFLLFLLSNPLYFSEALDNKTGQVRYPSVFTSASVLKKPGDLSPVDMSSSSVEATNTNKHSFVPLETSTWFQETAMRQEALNKCILPLTWAGHKGGSGRIGILGGSAQYTGAPFYASMASLKVGADLAFCFCAEEASIPIKSYSPELMVAPVYKAADFDSLVKTGQSRGNQAELLIQNMVDQVDGMMEKLHSLVVGPGLGRCPIVMEATSRIIRKAMSRNIPLIIDADGLFILTLPEYESVLREDTGSSEKSLIILTPNAMEWKRLDGLAYTWDQDRVIVVQKGCQDMIRFKSGEDESSFSCKEIGGLKRSGGIGDILAGTLGTVIAWNKILVEKGEASRLDAPLACWFACSLVKRSTHVAFNEHHRAMTAPDVLHALGSTFHAMTTI